MNVINGINRDNCTGCKMCADLCPNSAISFVENEQGFWYPECTPNKCIDCNICIKKCPVRENSPRKKTNRKGYVAWTKDDRVRRKSTSGGLYYEFARKVLSEGGYIVGSIYSDDYCSAYHIVTNKQEDLARVMGSKYFQSDTANIYKRTSELVQRGERVLFTGTPCQTAALDSYLGRKYDNLIMVDFLCRGVPSPLLHKKKIESYTEKANSRVIYYSDKTKPYGWSDFGETIEFANGKKKFISRWKDDINDCFIEKNLNLREACYKCEFKDDNRLADITIGDFWGVTNVTDKDLIYGVSCMITNTEKGERFVFELGDKIYKGRRPISEISKHNLAYIEASRRPENRDLFYDYVKRNGLNKAVKHFTNRTLFHKTKSEIKVIKGKLRETIVKPSELKGLNIWKFFYYNYLCKQVRRQKGAYILPYRGSYLYVGKTAEINLNGSLLINYYPCYKRGNQMTRFRVENGAKLDVYNRVELSYGNTFSLDENAHMSIGYFYTGVGANVICQYNMTIGNNVMLGRDVCVFDSDYHDIMNDEGSVINPKKEVIIEDNCWIGARSMVLKGSHIKQGAIISANSMVMGEVEGKKVFVNKRESKSIGAPIIWERY